jgi:hypothetical protein
MRATNLLAGVSLLLLVSAADAQSPTSSAAAGSDSALLIGKMAAAPKRAKGNDIPSSENYQGLSRKVLQYSENFIRISDKVKQHKLTDADWAPMEQLIDIESWRRLGVFTNTSKAEILDWQQYKKAVARYSGEAVWEGTFRRITEAPGLVFLELEERSTDKQGAMSVVNTVTIYKFNDSGKLVSLDDYVMPLANPQ